MWEIPCHKPKKHPEKKSDLGMVYEMGFPYKSWEQLELRIGSQHVRVLADVDLFLALLWFICGWAIATF